MRMRLAALLVAILVLIAIGRADSPKPQSTTAVADQYERRPMPVGRENPSKARWDRIEAEINRLGDHEWAGVYQSSISLGWNPFVALAPESGISYFATGCLGVYDFNEGDIAEFKNNRFSFRLRYESKKHSRCLALYAQMVLVKWGPRRYLVPEQYMRQFCSIEVPYVDSIDTSKSSEIPATRYLLRNKGGDQPVIGIPEVPEEFRQFLPEHLQASKTKVDAESTENPRPANATSQARLGNLAPDVALLALRALNVSYDEAWPPPPCLSFTLQNYSVTDVRYDDKFVYVLLARMYQSTDSLRWSRCVLKAERGKPPKRVEHRSFITIDSTPDVTVIGIDEVPASACSDSTHLVMLCQMYFETIPRIGGPSEITGLEEHEDGITILGAGHRSPHGGVFGHSSADIRIAPDYSTAQLIEHSVYIP